MIICVKAVAFRLFFFKQSYGKISIDFKIYES